MKCLIGLLLVSFSTVMCQQPKPCAVPNEWESKLVQFFYSRNMTTFAKLSYDANGQRMRVAEELRTSEKRLFYDVIFLYSEKTMYVIKFDSGKKTRTCTKHALTIPFKKSKIPEDAKFVTQSYIGSGASKDTGLLVNLFSGVDAKTKARYMITVTNELCIPVNQVATLPRFGTTLESFYDVVLGNMDPERFIPPPECNDAEIQPLHPKKAKKHLRYGPLV